MEIKPESDEETCFNCGGDLDEGCLTGGCPYCRGILNAKAELDRKRELFPDELY